MTGALLIFLISLASHVRGDPPSPLATGLVYAPGHASVNYYSYPRYAFNYAVNDPHTGDNKAQWEKREGNVVKGAYSLVEPGGSVRLVEYFDDGNGFNAIVKRIGPNVHPVNIHHVPIYKAPIPLLEHGPTIGGPITIGPIGHLPHLAQAPLISGPMGAADITSIPLNKYPISKPLVTHGPTYPYNTPIIREPAHQISPIVPAYTTAIIHKPLFSPAHEPILKQVHVSEIASNDHSYAPLTHHLPKPKDHSYAPLTQHLPKPNDHSYAPLTHHLPTPNDHSYAPLTHHLPTPNDHSYAPLTYHLPTPNDHLYAPLTHHLPTPNDHSYAPLTHHLPTPNDHSYAPLTSYLEPNLLNKYVSPESHQPESYYNSDHIGGYH